MTEMAVQEQGRARVVYGPPTQRRAATGGGLSRTTLLLAALVLFLGGLALGRALYSSAPPAAAPAATATAAPPASAVPRATTGAVPAAPSATGAATSEVGPRRVVANVPVGYAHSRQGAVAAATNYATTMSSPLILDAAARHRAVAVLAAPVARAALNRSLDQTVPLIAKGLGVSSGSGAASQVVLRAIPVGWRLEAYDGSTARVAIWATGVGGSLNGTPVQEGWGVTTIQLVWVDGDWKELGATTTAGPVPLADEQTPTAPSELVPKARAFKEYHYAPGP
jgi:hypothetical protein